LTRTDINKIATLSKANYEMRGGNRGHSRVEPSTPPSSGRTPPTAAPGGGGGRRSGSAWASWSPAPGASRCGRWQRDWKTKVPP